MRILALVPGGIGDQIHFFPTLETLKQQYSQAAIDVLVEPRAKTAYRVCKNVNEVLLFDYQDRNSLADYLNLLGVIRDREYDAAISANAPWTIGLLLWLNGIPTRVGYGSRASWYLSHPVNAKTEQYLPQMYHDLLTGLGIQTPCPLVNINVPTEDIAGAEAEQKRLGIKDSGYILIYDLPGSESVSESTYGNQNWQQIIRNIRQKQSELPIVILQSADNGDWITAMVSSQNDLLTTFPKDIGKLATMIAGANLILCPQSIPLYLSLAVGTYTVALLDSGNYRQLLPPNNDSYVAIQSTTDKIADINPEKVIEQIWRG